MTRAEAKDYLANYRRMYADLAPEKMLDALDVILAEQPGVDLEKEIEKEWKECDPIDEGMGVETANIHIEAFDIIARHFYELGQKDAANKYDEIEYNRQRAQEREGQR